MLTLNIDNPAVENYFHQDTDEIFRTLEAIALSKARLVAIDNEMPQAALEIQQDIEAYRSGELKTTRYSDGMDEMMQELQRKHADK